MVGEDEVVTCAGGTAHVHKVTVGAREGDRVSILDGLKAGDRVVVDHALGLEEGQPLVERK
jgi:multidrug efflux system membrane fusion protein